jgi:hypothetical protein
MGLDDAREALKRAAIEFAAGDIDEPESIKALCIAAIAYAAERAKLAPRAQAKEASKVVLPFGKEKGLPLTEAKTDNLEWTIGVLRTSIDDPNKARWADDNRRLVEAIERELATR